MLPVCCASVTWHNSAGLPLQPNRTIYFASMRLPAVSGAAPAMRNTFIWIHFFAPTLPRLVGSLLFSIFSCLGNFFHFPFENEDKLFAGFSRGELGMNLHFLYSRPHLHVCSFSVVPPLPKGNWTVYFCVYLKSVGVVIKFPMTPFPQLHTLK